MNRSISPFEKYGKSFPATDATLRVHTVSVTDSISALAQKYYDDWREWRLIAERNRIADVRKLTPGTTLIIPRRPLRKGVYEAE